MEAWAKRTIGCGVGCVMIPILGALLAVGTYQWWLSSSQAEAERLIAAAREAGQPVSDADLNAAYSELDGQRDVTAEFWELSSKWADEQYKLAIQPLPVLRGGFDFPRQKGLFKEQDECHQFLETQRESLDSLYALVAEDTTCRFELPKLSTGAEHIDRLDAARRLVLLESAIAARIGDADAAARGLQAQFWLARVMMREPSAIAQTLGGVHFEIACQLIADCVPHVPFSEQQLSEFEAAIEAFDSSSAMRQTVYGERAVGLQILADPSMIFDDPDTLREAKNTLSADRWFFLSVMAKMIDAADLPAPQRYQEVTRLQRSVLKQFASARGRLGYQVSRALLPSLQAITSTPIHSEAIGKAALIAIKIERFRRQKKRLPKSLAELELKPDALLDPLSGESLKVRIEAGRVRIQVSKAKLDHEQQADGHEGHQHGPPKFKMSDEVRMEFTES